VWGSGGALEAEGMAAPFNVHIEMEDERPFRHYMGENEKAEMMVTSA
jgi:hypothetical protein